MHPHGERQRPRGHAHHDHGAVGAANERAVFWAFVLTAGFMAVEVAGGLITGSLALLADAGHMLTDAVSLALAWAGFRVSRRPHDRRRTYGYHRSQVLAAFVNGASLIAIVGWIAVEAVLRLFEPVQVMAPAMLAVAVLGLLVNLGAFVILRRGERENLNIQGAALHVLGDLLGSIAAIVAGLVILATGWMPIDPLLSLLIAALVLRSAWMVVRRSAHILLEGAPDWLDREAFEAELRAAVPELRGVHHVHAWMLTQERPLMTFHAEVAPNSDRDRVLRAITELVERRYGVGHVTVQVEAAGCAEETVAPSRPD